MKYSVLIAMLGLLQEVTVAMVTEGQITSPCKYAQGKMQQT